MKRLISLLLVVIVAPLATAQPLVDRVPGDAMVYVGWSGTENAPGYSGSHAEALIKESNIPAVFKQVLPGVIERIRREDPNAADGLKLAYELLAPMAKYPTAFFFSGVIFEGEPMPRLGLVCRAGADAEAVRAKIQGLLDKENDADLPLKVIADGQDVAILIGYSGEPNALAGNGVAELAENANFKSTIAKIQSESVVSVYVDIEKIVELVDKGVQFHDPGNAEWNELFPKVMDSFGLRGLQRVAITGGFDGKDWMTRAFVAAPAPRTGLLAMADAPEIANDLLKAVPASAELFAAGSFDVGKLITEINTALGKLNPEWQKMFNQGLGAATMALGTNLQTGVLDPLGAHWLMYSAPEVSGGGFLGMVLVNKPDDAYKAKSGLMAVSLFASNTASSLLAQQDAPVTIQGKRVNYGDLAINYVAVPLITPAWAAQGDFIFFGLYPQSVIGAARQIEAKSSILDNQDYQKLRARLGVEKVHGVSYANLPATAPAAYQGFLAISRLVGAADLFGVPTPPIVIPPYHVLAEHLTVAGSVSWTDDAGVHMKHVAPFPGAELFQGGPGMAPAVGMVALQTSILLPSLNRARETANRVKSGNNLRQIGLACKLYANENRGNFPPDIETIVKTQDISWEVFSNPRQGGRAMQLRGEQTPDEIAAAVGARSDYVYIGAGKQDTLGAEEVLAYEKPSGLSDGVNVLFGDAHVEFLTFAQAARYGIER